MAKQVTSKKTVIGVVEQGSVAENVQQSSQEDAQAWTKDNFRDAEKRDGEAILKPATGTVSRTRNLYVKVDTFDKDGKTVGTRIVDMYHFGTRNWLQNHHWWAMHNAHTVETQVASDDEIVAYLAEQKLALAAKFNHEKAHVAA